MIDRRTVLAAGLATMLRGQQPDPAPQKPVGPKWRLQYQYDKDNSTLVVTDLKFPSPQRGIALAVLEEKGKSKPVSVVTSNGGRSWTVQSTHEQGVALFFLNDSIGWMATEKGVWYTEESGASWKKIADLKGLRKLAFLDAQHGFAVGYPKAIFKTVDGGRHWTPVPEAKTPESTEEFTSYDHVQFMTPKIGLIAGHSQPPRKGRRTPEWMDPSSAVVRRELPSLTITLETRDAGATWKPQTVSAFGVLIAIRLLADSTGLAVFEFRNAFEWPAEAYRLDLKTGKSVRTFRDRNRLITDALIFEGHQGQPGYGVLATIEPTGRSPFLPVPGKLRMLESADLQNWTEIPSDYRATGRRVMLAGPDPDHVWAATDSGMILKLER